MSSAASRGRHTTSPLDPPRVIIIHVPIYVPLIYYRSMEGSAHVCLVFIYVVILYPGLAIHRGTARSFQSCAIFTGVHAFLLEHTSQRPTTYSAVCFMAQLIVEST